MLSMSEPSARLTALTGVRARSVLISSLRRACRTVRDPSSGRDSRPAERLEGLFPVVRELGQYRVPLEDEQLFELDQLKQSGPLTVSPSSDVWKIEAVGSTISGYQNGTLVVQATDTNINSGSPGVWLYYSSNQIDNWSGGDVAATYPIGGSVSGLSGPVVLQDNGGDDLSVSASGAFTFATGLTAGSAYNVTVKTSPARQRPARLPTGRALSGRQVSPISRVTCTAAATYPIGGSVTDLSGPVVLQDNGGDDLSVSASGAFTFTTASHGGLGL